MVIGQFSPITGGAERQCLTLCRALHRRGHEVRVLTVWQSRDWPRREEIEGVTVERVWYPQLRLFAFKIVGFGFLAWLTFTCKVLKTIRGFDIVHVHQGLWPAFSATLAATLAGKPILCKIGNSGARFDLRVLWRNHLYGPVAVQLMKRKVERFVSTSTAVGRDLQSWGIPSQKLAHIPNGVELREEVKGLLSHPGRKRTDDQVRFLFVGSLTAKKNTLLFPEALKRLPSDYRNRIRLTVLGDGPQRSTLADRLQADGLTRSVQLAGFVGQPDEHFLNSEVFVLPSLTEGLSNAALEAMSWGLPLILSFAGGNTDLVERRENPGEVDINRRHFVEGCNGLLVDPGRAESLAEAFKFMIDYPEKRLSMGRRSYEIVAARYSMDRVVGQYEALYDQCRFPGGQNR